MRHALPSLVAAVLAAGCGAPTPRVTTYTESHFPPAGAPEERPAAPAAPRLKWTLPPGWTESAGGGMSLATFLPPDWSGPERATLSVMGGAAGGLEANVRRWMKQIGLDSSDEQNVREFLKSLKPEKTAGGSDCVLVDFTALPGPAEGGGASMLVGQVSLPGRTAFLKLTGPPDRLAAVRGAFRSLCLSLQPGESP